MNKNTTAREFVEEEILRMEKKVEQMGVAGHYLPAYRMKIEIDAYREVLLLLGQKIPGLLDLSPATMRIPSEGDLGFGELHEHFVNKG